MKPKLHDLVEKWVDKPAPVLTKANPIIVEPDFETPLPRAYSRKEDPVGSLKEKVRVAVNTANVLGDLNSEGGENEELAYGKSGPRSGRPRTTSLKPEEEEPVDLLEPTRIFQKAFGVDSVELEEAQELLGEKDKGTKKRSKKAMDVSVPTTALFNTYTAQKLSAILTEYDHKVVDDTVQMRTYVTNRLIEVSKCGDTKYELRALELLGKVSDIGLFSEKTEINVTHTAGSLEHALKDKINRLKGTIERDSEGSFLIEEMPFEAEPEEVDITPPEGAETPEEEVKLDGDEERSETR